jgi:hypothetical protein
MLIMLRWSIGSRCRVQVTSNVRPRKTHSLNRSTQKCKNPTHPTILASRTEFARTEKSKSFIVADWLQRSEATKRKSSHKKHLNKVAQRPSNSWRESPGTTSMAMSAKQLSTRGTASEQQKLSPIPDWQGMVSVRRQGVRGWVVKAPLPRRGRVSGAAGEA